MDGTQSRRDFLKQVGLAGAALSASGFPLGCLSPDDRRLPNVVLIFMDDMGYGDVGTYGARGYSTPNLDRLAAQGMRFTDFYASQAVCSASRASLLTGCYSERVSILGALGPNAPIGLHPQEETLAELLKARGYATGMVGKWHLGDAPEYLPLQHGFDEYLGIPYSNDMWPVNYDGTPATEGNKGGYPPLPLIDGNEVRERLETLEDQDRITTLYTERAVSFIDRSASGPFFLYLAHSMVHVPLGVSERFRGTSEQGMFGDVMQEVDWSVGQILEALDRNGVAENTLVIFTSDNGPWLNFGNHAGSTGGLREGKGTAFEGGPRVVSIWRWPGRIPEEAVSPRMGSTLDVLPTVAAITGAALPSLPIDGVSILPVLEGDPEANPRDTFYFYYGAELRGVREGKWKRVFEHRTRSYVGVEPGRDGVPGPYVHPVVPAALYDLEADVAETTDVSGQHPDVVARLDALAEEARAALGDRLTGRRGSEVRPPGRRAFERPDRVEHLAVGAAVTLSTSPSPQYPGDGPGTLTDGVQGTRDFHDFRWLGFSGDDLEAVVDLGEGREVARVGLSCLQAQGSWIFLPQWVEVAISDDGEKWTDVGRVAIPRERNSDVRAVVHELEVGGMIRSGGLEAGASGIADGTGAVADAATGGAGVLTTRFIRVRARNQGPLPEWHPGSPNPAWLFVDEIVME